MDAVMTLNPDVVNTAVRLTSRGQESSSWPVTVQTVQSSSEAESNLTRSDALGVAGSSVMSSFPMNTLEPEVMPVAVCEGGWEEEAPLVEAAAWVCERGCKEGKRCF